MPHERDPRQVTVSRVGHDHLDTRAIKALLGERLEAPHQPLLVVADGNDHGHRDAVGAGGGRQGDRPHRSRSRPANSLSRATSGRNRASSDRRIAGEIAVGTELRGLVAARNAAR